MIVKFNKIYIKVISNFLSYIIYTHILILKSKLYIHLIIDLSINLINFFNNSPLSMSKYFKN